jgi:diguanylate cyclase (GGDEF)-like protein/PAS domain S-box-containing protein
VNQERLQNFYLRFGPGFGPFVNHERLHNLFLRIIPALGAVVSLYCLFRLDTHVIDIRFVFLATVTLCFGSRLGIEFSKHRIQVSVSDSFIFLALLLYGTEPAVLLAAAEAFCSSFRFTTRWLTRLFNAALLAIATFLTGSAANFFFGSVTEIGREESSTNLITAICLLGLVQFAVNTSIPAFRQALKFNLPVFHVWKENYLWISVTYFTGASAAVLTSKLVAGYGFLALVAMVPIVVIVYFTYQTYRKQLQATVNQAEQAERHAEEQKVISEALKQSMAEQEVISQALRKSEEHFRSAFDYAAVGMALIGTDGRWLSVNHSLCQLVGYTDEELLQTNFQAITHTDDLGADLVDFYQMLEGKIVTFTREKRYIHKGGHIVWATVNASSVLDESGRPMHFILQAQDITERKRAEEKLYRAAFYDALTSLPNRRLFADQLTRAIHRAVQHPDEYYAVLFLDVDRFKNVNDSLGHVVGDQLLVGVARRLEKCVRPEDMVSRFGGDEFAILLNRLQTPTDAILKAERIQTEMSQPFNIAGHEVYCGGSIGVALSTPEYNDPDEVLRDADTAMYRAKEQGKGRIEIFGKIMHTRAILRLKLENDLRRAVDREEFEIYYQPIVDLQTGFLTGFEALLRWRHPERGVVSPEDFIAVAEETELIIPIGQWVLQESCRQVREWQTKWGFSSPLTISVNLSGKQFKQNDLIEQVKQTLLETKLDPQYLRLEITESMLMDDAEAATDMLRQLRSLGVKLSIDDFGTGYSSLSYLHRFPIDILKIDRSFVTRMVVDEESLGIVETVIALAAKLRMKVVAEGVETKAQCEQLRNFNCEYGQGYFFSKPVPAWNAEELIDSDWQRQNGPTSISPSYSPTRVNIANERFVM